MKSERREEWRGGGVRGWRAEGEARSDGVKEWRVGVGSEG